MVTVAARVGLGNGIVHRQAVRRRRSLQADRRRTSIDVFLFISKCYMEIAGYCRIPWAGPESFPLDCAGGLRGYVVDHAIYAFHLVHDAGGDLAEQIEGKAEEVGRHAVDG